MNMPIMIMAFMYDILSCLFESPFCKNVVKKMFMITCSLFLAIIKPNSAFLRTVYHILSKISIEDGVFVFLSPMDESRSYAAIQQVYGSCVNSNQWTSVIKEKHRRFLNSAGVSVIINRGLFYRFHTVPISSLHPLPGTAG